MIPSLLCEKYTLSFHSSAKVGESHISLNQTEQKRRKRGGKDEAGGESGAKMPFILHF
jgi:hypothetical protein